MSGECILGEIDALCHVEYGTRVVQKKDGGTIYPVYGGGGATFYMNSYNREDRLVIARFAMSKQCTRLVSGKFFLNDSGLTISPKDKTKIDQNFLDYYCLAMNDLFYSISRGTAQKNLDVPIFRKLKINIPRDIKLQQSIVKKLDVIFSEIEKAITCTEDNIKNAEALFQSYLKTIFTDTEFTDNRVSLDQVTTITSSKRIMKKEYVSIGIPFYRTKEIKQLANNKDISTELFIERSNYLKIKSRFGVPKKGDVLLTAIGTIGEIYVVPNNDEFYFKDGNVLWIKDFINIESEYLKFVLMSFVVQLNEMSQGAAYSALPINKLKTHKILVPNQEIQIKIINKIRDIQSKSTKLKESFILKLDHLKKLKQSILYEVLGVTN